jgi:hypothetical protein
MKSIVNWVSVLVALVLPVVAFASGDELSPAAKELKLRQGSRAADLLEGKTSAIDGEPNLPKPFPRRPPFIFPSPMESDRPELADVWQALCRFLSLSWAWIRGHLLLVIWTTGGATLLIVRMRKRELRRG